LYDSGVDGDISFYAMEYVEGETLTVRLRREKRLPWEEVIRLSVQICSALKAAHDAGIIHRDLKPSNLLLTPDGTIKLTDFGVAQLFAADRLTLTGGVIGTAEYMSPEQAEGKRATKKSDLYSLGAVMYAMLCGRPPFSGTTTMDVMHKHRFGRFDRPRLVVPEIPIWLDDIVCQLLEKDPDKRVADAFVLSRQLQQVPKKVELSRSEQTLFAEGQDIAGTAPTLAAAGERRTGNLPGGGTLMRDLMKAEVERAQLPTTIGGLLNNIWVLLGLLALLIGGGVVWYNAQHLGPQERFEAGVELLERPQGPAWTRAREDYFAPLVEEDAGRWSAKAGPYLEQIEQYERNRRTRRQVSPRSEPERLLRLARAHEEAGEFARAESVLTALVVLLEDNAEFAALREIAEQDLQIVRAQRADAAEAFRLVEQNLERADRLAEEGQDRQARAIWDSIVTLYASNPQAAEYVERARTRLESD
ncbi:MAG: protein kinase domain-containing protein, partial [Planctomycetaceae bacterium]